MSVPSRKTGVLLLNVGTPDAPRAPEVRRYLREFLGDGRVLDLPPLGRWLLLNLVILPFRPAKSAEAYRQVWTPEGSPLLVNSRAFATALADRLGPEWEVALAMRYGSPSIADALRRFRSAGIDRVVLFPLYPQYAAATTATSLAAVYDAASAGWDVPTFATVPPFHDDPGFLSAFEAVGRPVLERLRPDHVLFSFHGLPERQVRRSDPTGNTCLASAGCCEQLGADNAGCYRAQCFETARRLGERLGIEPARRAIAFQSRLGKTPWIRPYTDEVVRELAGKGVKRLAVFSPAFVADCLETLEEIGMRAREDFLAHGGEAFELVPSLNANAAWVDAAAELVRRAR